MPHLKKEINNITKLNFKGWGRFSKKLLIGLKCKNVNGEYCNIMYFLENTNMNFMQVLTERKFGFNKMIEKSNSMLNNDKSNNAIQDMVSKLSTSPANKKAILQAIQIVKEIVHIRGSQPENIFVEFARSNEEKVRTQSRKKALEKMYKDLNIEEGLKKQLKSDLSKNEKVLDKRRFYLYFLQAGKCLYTGTSLNINQLENYQIDHILPRTLGDDSLDNVALVIGKENQYKSNELTLDSNIIQKQKEWWKKLHKAKMMSSKKLYNLSRLNFSEKDVSGFMNKQLVETRQIIKNTSDILNSIFDKTKVVAIKAGLVSELRKKYNLCKIRELNDLHHAHDAFLSAVIGIYILKKYPSMRNDFIVERNAAKHFFDNDLREILKTKSEVGFLVSQINSNLQTDKKTGEVIWDGSCMIPYIEKVFSYRDVFITKKAESNTGELFNATVISAVDASKAKKPIQIKKGRDVKKYGGYTNVNNAFACVIQYEHKKGLKYEIIDIPIYVAQRGDNGVLKYIKEQKHESVLVLRKLLPNQLLKVNDSLFYFKSSSERNNAVQLLLNIKYQRILFNLLNDKKVSSDEICHLYLTIVNKMKDYYFEFKKKADSLLTLYDVFITLDKENQKKVILDILKATKAGAGRVDNLIVGENKLGALGRIQTSYNIKDVEIIDQSVTGMFEKKIKL